MGWPLKFSKLNGSFCGRETIDATMSNSIFLESGVERKTTRQKEFMSFSLAVDIMCASGDGSEQYIVVEAKFVTEGVWKVNLPCRDPHIHTPSSGCLLHK